MRGIQYIYDKTGKKRQAVIDLQQYGKEFELFLQKIQPNFSNNSNQTIGDNIEHLGQGAKPIRSVRIQQLLQYAYSFLGTPYRTGGTTKSGMDCSGFTQNTFKAISIQLPRVSRDQSSIGKAIAKENVQLGDLVFFATGTPGRINHVGIVSESLPEGGFKFIHASSSRGISFANSTLNYWMQNYMTARRIF